MQFEILGVILIFIATILLAIPLGKFIGKIYNGDKTFVDFIFNPLDKLIFKLSGINTEKEMNWKQHLVALLTINLVWFLFSMFVLMNMGWLPLNPDDNPSMSADLAFNTSISFISNTNIQHYSGETAVSYLGQLVLMLFQFISAGTGMAVCAVVFNAMKERTTDMLGNFYNYFVKSCTRVLLPLSIVVAVILLFNGMPMTFKGKEQFISLQGDTVQVSRGPAAAMISIKQLGTNGGGFFGANSAHPFENPNYITNVVENISILLIPIAMVFALGFILKRKKLA
jgi:K+-transporting ATPase ATPase A chain